MAQKPERQADTICTPLGGRTTLMCNERTVQLFAQLVADGDDPEDDIINFGTIFSFGNATDQKNGSRAERLWSVRTSATEVHTEIANPATQGPLTRTVITNGPLGAASARGGTTVFKARVKVASSNGYSFFDVDLGQTIEIVGYSVDVDIIGPVNTVEVGSNLVANPVAATDGHLIDTIVGISINEAEAPVGHKRYRFTTYHPIPNNTPVSVPIPRFAQTLKYTMGVGVLLVAPDLFIGDPAVLANLATNVGVVPFNGAGNASEGDFFTLPACTTLDINAENVGVRFMTCMWEIEP